MTHAPTAYYIEDAAQMAGTTPSVLRVWEARYGWPRPKRDHSSGFRVYPPTLIAELRRIVALTHAGHVISDLIVDGMPAWPDAKKAPPMRWTRYAQIPVPTDREVARFQVRLAAALRRRDHAAALLALHSAFIVLRPRDRLLGAWMPAVFGAREWELAGRPLPRDVLNVVRRLAGDAMLQEIEARWATAMAIG